MGKTLTAYQQMLEDMRSDGLTQRAIAERIHKKESSVKTYFRNINRKLRNAGSVESPNGTGEETDQESRPFLLLRSLDLNNRTLGNSALSRSGQEFLEWVLGEMGGNGHQKLTEVAVVLIVVERCLEEVASLNTSNDPTHERTNARTHKRTNAQTHERSFVKGKNGVAEKKHPPGVGKKHPRG